MAVVGRDQELSALSGFLDRDGGGPSTLLVEGDAGMGKTTLCRAAVGAAEARGYRVLRCTASEAESGLAFTGLRDLLGDVFAEVADELLAPQRRALGVVLLQEESRGPPPKAGAVGLSVLNTLRLTSRGRPVAFVVDDVQWLDEPSALALAYAVRRLEADAPVVVLAARRRGTGDALGLDDLPTDAVRRLGLGPLSVGALGRVVSRPRPPTPTWRSRSTGRQPSRSRAAARARRRNWRRTRSD